MISLDKRLATIAHYVRLDKTICDVGTDHAFLPCFLKQQGAEKLIASDINDGPLEAARRTMEQNGIDGISLVKSDGVKNIEFCEDLIIAGMGGELIADIISHISFLSDDLRLILQPMTKAEILRKSLYELGFEIIEESVVYDGRKKYVVIYARYTGVVDVIGEEFSYIGKIIDREYVEQMADNFDRIAESMEQSEKSLSESVRFRNLAIKLHSRFDITVKKVFDFLNDFAPISTKDKYDNVGLIVGDENTVVTKALLCLDITNDVVDEAVKTGANLIISHHPVIFNPLYTVLKGTPVYAMVENKISGICMHTNLDIAKGGISDIMLDLLGFHSDEVLDVVYENGLGYGRISNLPFSTSAKALAEKCKEVFDCKSVRFSQGKNEIQRAAVCSGSGGSELSKAIEKKCDCLITGDIKHDVWIDAKNKSISLIDAGHFCTENIVCHQLLTLLSREFNSLEINVAESNEEPCDYV